ncbi:MAG: MFS transporter [Dehalobacterium sp.]|jgi:DHA3 family macrolide efflux protein-like MFS transporter
MKNNWIKNTILFIGSQTISLFGSSLVQFAILWHITLTTQSGMMMTISILCGFLPTLFISPFAGVWADRYNRKFLIIFADAMIASFTLLLAILYLMGYEALWLLFVISAIRSFGSGVQSPAVGAFLPQIVPEDRLMRVNATNGSIQSLIMLASPMLGGALLTVSTIETIFFLDVITAIIAITTLLFFLHVPAHRKAREKQAFNYFTDMKEGLAYVKKHDFVRHFFIFCAIFFFLAAPVAFLTPLQVTRSFGADVWRLTAIEIAFASGMMLGGFVIAYWGGFKNKIHTMTLSCLCMGFFTLSLGIIPYFPLYLLIMGLSGLVMPFFNTPSTVLLQEKVDENFLGRVFGILTMIASSTMPLGMLFFGPLSDMIKIEWILIATGFLMFIQGFFLMRNHVLLEAGKAPA